MSAKPSLRTIILWLTVLFAPLATALAQSFVHPRDQIALQLGAAQMGYELPFTLTGANMQRACNALVMGRNALDAAVGKPAVKVKDFINSPNVETLEYRDQLYSAVEHVFRSPVVGTLKGSVVMADNKKVAVNVKLTAATSSWTIPVPFAMEAGSFADENALKAQISALSEKVDSLARSVATVTQNISSLTTKATSLEKGVDAASSTVTALSENLTSLSSRATSIETNAGTAASTVESLTKNLSALTNRATSLETNTATTLQLLTDFSRLQTTLLYEGTALDYAQASVTTFAGSGQYGTSDGIGSIASFSYSPRDPVLDGAGNLYLSEGTKIRKITPVGVVSTFAGSEVGGSIDGTGNSAGFGQIDSLAADGSGNLYLIDGGRIRKVTPERKVTTLQIGSDASPLYFDNISPGIVGSSLFTLDQLGNVYAMGRSSSGSHKLIKISAEEQVVLLAGSDSTDSTDGVGAGASFGEVQGVVVDSLRNVYVSENGGPDNSSKIRKVSPTGTVTTLSNPLGFLLRNMVADSAGNVFGFSSVVDVDKNPQTVLVKVAPDGLITTIAGPGSVSDGTITNMVRDGVGQRAYLGGADFLKTDTLGNLYFVNGYGVNSPLIRRVSPAGVVSTLAGGRSYGQDGDGYQAGFSASVTGIAPDKAGNVYVLDAGAYKIRKISVSP